jgi:hypothetical protein
MHFWALTGRPTPSSVPQPSIFNAVSSARASATMFCRLSKVSGYNNFIKQML